MTFHSTSGAVSIFQSGRLKPGVYKIQNLYTEKYLDIHEHSNALCCRPAHDLRDGKGLWEIKTLGDGHTVRRVDPGKPEQFCTTIEGLNNGTALHVAPYPAAWRIEAFCDGSENLRFYWGTTQKTWDSHSDIRDQRTGASDTVWRQWTVVDQFVSQVVIHDEHEGTWQTWKLIPMRVENVFTPLSSSSGNLDSGALPSYDVA